MTTTRRSFIGAALALGATALLAPANAFAKATGKPAEWIGEHETAQFAMDSKTGEVLFEENADKLTYIASTTKIMTAAVVFHAIKEGWITKDTMFTASKGILDYNNIKDSCTMGLKVGEPVSVHDLLMGIMVASGNDAAVVLAEGLGKILREKMPEMCSRHADPKVPAARRDFISFMNSKAEDLGLKNTHFQNPNGFMEKGLDVNYSTAREMTMLLRTVHQNNCEECKTYFNKPVFIYKGRKYQNHNEMQGRNPCIWGGKSGFTNEARRCLGVFGGEGDVEIDAFVLHAPTGPPGQLNVVRNTMMGRLFANALALAKTKLKKPAPAPAPALAPAPKPLPFISTKDNPIINI